jgi:hypothetical protein
LSSSTSTSNLPPAPAIPETDVAAESTAAAKAEAKAQAKAQAKARADIKAQAQSATSPATAAVPFRTDPVTEAMSVSAVMASRKRAREKDRDRAAAAATGKGRAKCGDPGRSPATAEAGADTGGGDSTSGIDAGASVARVPQRPRRTARAPATAGGAAVAAGGAAVAAAASAGDDDSDLTLLAAPYYAGAPEQPFSIDVSSSALTVVDCHAHMSANEVIGLLGGRWMESSGAVRGRRGACSLDTFESMIACLLTPTSKMPVFMYQTPAR